MRRGLYWGGARSSSPKLASWASLQSEGWRQLKRKFEDPWILLWKIQQALEAAGVEFIPEEAGRGPGVRLKQAQDKRR